MNLKICFTQRPYEISEAKKYFSCCLLRYSGLLEIKAGIPVTGYVPGQTIELLLKVNNHRDQAIENFDVHIVKVSWKLMHRRTCVA